MTFVHPSRVWHLPNFKGVLISNHQHKTSGSSGTADTFSIENSTGLWSWETAARAFQDESRICSSPVEHAPYLFMNHRPDARGYTVMNVAFARQQLKKALVGANVSNGLESLHGLRVALAVEKRLDNTIELAAVNKLSKDMRWASEKTAAQYSAFAQGAITSKKDWTAFISKCTSTQYTEFLFFMNENKTV